jgi:predicted N-acyltransferase
VVQLRVLKSIDEVSPEAWNALVPAGAPPVLKYEWIHAMESSGSASKRAGWEAHHFAAFEGGILIGAAPAWRKHHSMGEYVYDFGWAQASHQFGVDYYPKLLVGVPLSPITAQRFLGTERRALAEFAVKSAQQQGLSSIHIIFPPDDEAAELETYSLGLFRRSGMQYHWKNPGYRTYDDYLSRFDSKRRHQLKRERGAAQTQGITLRTVPGSALTSEHAKLAYRFYEATCEKNGWGGVQLNAKFFERAFATMPDDLEMVLAERQGKAIAGAFNLVSPKRLFGRYWGCFEDVPFLHFNVCLYHSVDECIRSGREVFEPGAGGEHKIPRGFEPTAIHSLHRAFDLRFDAALRDFCRRETAHVQRVLAESTELAGLKPWEPKA